MEMKEQPQEQPPVAELDEEACAGRLFGFWWSGLLFWPACQEQKLWFLPRPVTDMVSTVFNSDLPQVTTGCPCIFGASPPKLNRAVQGSLTVC